MSWFVVVMWEFILLFCGKWVCCSASICRPSFHLYRHAHFVRLDFSMDPKTHPVRLYLIQPMELKVLNSFFSWPKLMNLLLVQLQFVVLRLSDLAMTNLIIPTSYMPGARCPCVYTWFSPWNWKYLIRFFLDQNWWIYFLFNCSLWCWDFQISRWPT